MGSRIDDDRYYKSDGESPRLTHNIQTTNDEQETAKHSHDFDDEDEGNMTYFGSFCLAARRSFPTILTMIFFQGVQFINIYFVGHLGTTKLAGVGLGTMLLNVFVFAVAFGLNGTIESFVGWAFGNQQFKDCGMHLNRGRFIVTAMLIPTFIMFFWIDKILIALKQDEDVSRVARNYVCMTMPGVIALVQFDSVKRFLQTINRSFVSTMTQCTTTVLHLVWCIIFIRQLELEVLGAALALNTTYIINYLIQELYIRAFDWAFFSQFIEPFFTPKTFSWDGAVKFLKLGIPGTMMQCAEWWAFEVLAIFAGILGEHHLAAQVAVINIIGMIYMVPLGIQFSASAAVGAQVGAGNIAMAKRHAIMHHVYALVVMFTVVILISIFSEQVSTLFTKEPMDVYYIQEVLALLGYYVIADTVHGVNTGIVRGIGKQFIASIATFTCYYVLGMPLALVLGFNKEMGLTGFWLGFIFAVALQDIIVGLIILFADWEAARKANVGDTVVDNSTPAKERLLLPMANEIQ